MYYIEQLKLTLTSWEKDITQIKITSGIIHDYEKYKLLKEFQDDLTFIESYDDLISYLLYRGLSFKRATEVVEDLYKETLTLMN